MTFQEFLTAHGLPAHLQLDGELHRFNLYGRSRDGWFVGKQLPSGAVVANAGSWKSGEEWSLVDGAGAGADLSAEIATMRREQIEDKAKAQEACAERARALLVKTKTCTSHPYLTTKGFAIIPESPHVREDKGDLLVAMSNAERGHAVVGFQRISPDGEKRFNRGVLLDGSYHAFKGEPGMPVILCEGFATGLSIYEALHRTHHVVVCFNAGNLLKVALHLKPHFKNVIYFAADNDTGTTIKGKPVNVGVEAATLAASRTGGRVLTPPMAEADWNDYHAAHGLQATGLELRRQMLGYGQAADTDASLDLAADVFGLPKIEKAPTPIMVIEPPKKLIIVPQPNPADFAVTTGQGEGEASRDVLPDGVIADATPSVDSYKPATFERATLDQIISARTHHRVSMDDLVPLTMQMDGKGHPKLPPQQVPADAIAAWLGDSVMREDRDVFEWQGTHWAELSPRDWRSRMRIAIQHVLLGSGSDKYLDNCFNILMDIIPAVPRGQSFYKPLLNVANFLDGTLWILGSGTDASPYHLKFRPTSQNDLITSVLNIEYNTPRVSNPLFDDWLDRTFRGDDDAIGKIRALRMIGGACMIPLFPSLAFLYGPAGTGKSTFAKICMRFVGEDNYSALPPEEMHGFQLETMINKRVNIVTDISGGRVDKGIFKRFHDKMEIMVNRKGRQAIKARVPFFHLFCGNDLPTGMDLISTAMDRRMTIVEIKNQLSIDDMRQEIDQEIVNAGPGAILEFFEQGLRDLCASGGKYFKPESGKLIMEEHKLNNPMNDFLDALQNGQIDVDNEVLFCEFNARVSRPALVRAYMAFCQGSGASFSGSGRAFLKFMRDKGFGTVKSDGNFMVLGIGRKPKGMIF